MLDGTAVNGPVELRKALLKKPEIFVSTLTEKLMIYALGRGLSADIILRHSSISKCHAFVGKEDGVWHVVDADSKNGTSLNGARLAPRRRKALSVGDQISFGSIDALFLDAGTLWRVLRTAR